MDKETALGFLIFFSPLALVILFFSTGLKGAAVTVLVVINALVIGYFIYGLSRYIFETVKKHWFG